MRTVMHAAIAGTNRKSWMMNKTALGRRSIALLVLMLSDSACSGSRWESDGAESAQGGVGGEVSLPSDGSGIALSNVRCFDYGSDILCFGTPGTDNWAVVWPECRITAFETTAGLEPAGHPAEENCERAPGAADSLAGWDDIRCWRHIPSGIVDCYGKLGGYWIEIFPDCIWADVSTAYIGDPAEIFCRASSVDRGGWDELRCLDLTVDPMSAICYGRRGAYWVGATAVAHYANGLFPTCKLNPDGALAEVPPEQSCE